MPNPTPFKQIGAGEYHDFYVGFDPATNTDKFYGAGLGGYSVWDVTLPAAPKQLFTITSMGMDIAHTFTPSGRGGAVSDPFRVGGGLGGRLPAPHHSGAAVAEAGLATTSFPLRIELNTMLNSPWFCQR